MSARLAFSILAGLVLTPFLFSGSSGAAAPGSIGVAPFETIASPGAQIPDVARMLADRLATRGLTGVVGPTGLASLGTPDPTAAQVVEAARAAQVESVVVGRTTGIGSRLSIDVRMRSGKTGLVTRTYVAEAPRASAIEEAVDQIAEKIAAALDPGSESRSPVAAAPEPRDSSTTPAAAAEKAPAPPPEPSAAAKARPWEADGPISIESDELEAIQVDGARRLVFKRNVRATQGDMKLSSDELIAFYPTEQSQPNRLIAKGHVRLNQRGRLVRCTEATYDRVRNRVECRGNAELVDGGDTVRGEVIRMDLDTDRVLVTGGAKVFIKGEAAPQ